MNPLREKALALAKDLPPSAKNILRVGEQTSQEASSWAFSQWNLREVARSKFSRASEMLFTKEALEQATHERVAAYHASRFPEGVLVADLTAGIGADLIALAVRGPAVGYEIDSERAEYANWNLCARALSESAKAELADGLAALQSARRRWEYAFADPSRRVGGRRTLDPSSFSPDPEALANVMQSLKLGGIKLSPMLSDDYLESLGSELEFVSFAGECREALVWVGSEANSGRSAVLVDAGSRLASGEAPAPKDVPGPYLYEADPAAIRAHCLGTLCDQLGLLPLGDSNGYLTSDCEVSSPWLKGYRVVSEAVGDLKRLRSDLARLGAGTLVVKSRAPSVDVPKVARVLRMSGTDTAVVLAFPVGKSIRYVAAKPWP